MPNTIKANQWLSRLQLEVTSNSRRVFANGRQQVEITVIVEPRDNDELDEYALDSIDLALIDPDGNPQSLGTGLLVQNERDPRFEYHAAGGGSASPLMKVAPNTVRRSFYVSSTLPGGTLTTVYASIRKDADNYFITNTGSFQSSVVIESITPLRHPEAAFKLDMQERVSFRTATGKLRDAETNFDVGYFGFRDPNNSIVESIPHAVPSGEPFYKRNNWDHVIFSFELINDYSQICQVTTYAEGAPMDLNYNGRRFTPRAGNMAVSVYHQRFYDAWSNSINEDKSLWTVVDRHGNEQDIEFFTENSGRIIKFRAN